MIQVVHFEKKKKLDPKGRTPPFRRLACVSVLLASSTLLWSSEKPVSYNSFPHPSSFHDQFSRHLSVLVCPHRLDNLRPSSFQLLTIVCGCPCLPMDHPVLFQKHLLHVLLMSTTTCSPNSKVDHCGHFMPRSPGLHMTTTALPLHLSRCLRFKDPLPPSFLLLSSPSIHPHALPPIICFLLLRRFAPARCASFTSP